MRDITTEPLAAVKARQVIWPAWAAEATEGLADTDLVTVTTDHFPFGSYMRSIEPADAETCPVHGIGEVVRRLPTGDRFDPYEIVVVACGCEVVWMTATEGDWNHVLTSAVK